MQKSLTCQRVILSLLLCLGALAPAHAEKADRDKPVNIESDKMTADDNKKVTFFQGRVVLTQGTIRLTADQMTLREDPAGFKSASAFGNPVTFRQKRDDSNEWVDGVAQHAEYDEKQALVELFDKAVVRSGKDEIRGNYLSYDLNTEFLQARGAKNAGQAPGTGTGRVHVTLQPKHDANKPVQKPEPQTLKGDGGTTP